MRATRVLLGTAGIVMVLVGAYHLYDISTRGASRVVSIAVWTVGGVAVHDAVIAPLVVLGSVTLLAIPAFGRFGAREDVPSLLNRPYGVLWLGFAALVVAVVVAAALLRRRRTGSP